MKFLVLSLAFVALAVRCAEGQSCDSDKTTSCINSLTNTILSDNSIAQDKTRMCNVFQRYVDCILKEACGGVSLPNSVKTQVEEQLKKYGFDCDLNGFGGAAGLSGTPYIITIFLAALSMLFAL